MHFVLCFTPFLGTMLLDQALAVNSLIVRTSLIDLGCIGVAPPCLVIPTQLAFLIKMLSKFPCFLIMLVLVGAVHLCFILLPVSSQP